MNAIDRYRAGEHESVWAELRASGMSAADSDPARAVAWETMVRAKRVADRLAAELAIIGIELASFANGPLSTLDAMEAIAGNAPLSIRAFYEVIGSVCFLPQNPEALEATLGVSLELADPLVVYPLPNTAEEAQRWAAHRLRSPEPFELDLSPDAGHKAGVSGGPPYAIAFGQRSVDGIVLNEAHDVHFVEYLRGALRCAGFPGFWARAAGSAAERPAVLRPIVERVWEPF